MFHLIVVHEIPGYAKGALITDQDAVARILASNLAPSVVKVAAPPVDAPPAAPVDEV